MRFSESEHDKNWRNGRVEWLGKGKERFRWEMAPVADAVVTSCLGPTGCYVRDRPRRVNCMPISVHSCRLNYEFCGDPTGSDPLNCAAELVRLATVSRQSEEVSN